MEPVTVLGESTAGGRRSCSQQALLEVSCDGRQTVLRGRRQWTIHAICGGAQGLSFLSDVYDALRSEIRNDGNKITANINYALAGIGVVVALSSLIAGSQPYVLLLALPFVFYALILMNYGHHLGIWRIGSYLTTVVYPRIRTIIRELGGGTHDFGEFTVDWDESDITRGWSRTGLAPGCSPA